MLDRRNNIRMGRDEVCKKVYPGRKIHINTLLDRFDVSLQIRAILENQKDRARNDQFLLRSLCVLISFECPSRFRSSESLIIVQGERFDHIIIMRDAGSHCGRRCTRRLPRVLHSSSFARRRVTRRRGGGRKNNYKHVNK